MSKTIIAYLAVLDTRKGYKMELCGLEVKCYDNITRPCVRDKGHANGCNPFSNIVLTPQTPEVHDVGAPDAITGFQAQVPDGPEDRRATQLAMDARCFRNARQRGETTFSLIERDPTSPRTILFWIMENFDGKTPAPKLRDAFEDALQMLFSPIEKKRAD